MAGKIVLGVLAAALLAGTAGAGRFDRWEIIGPGGGGGQFNPTISPHNSNDVLENCDMTGAYVTHDGARTWRMFNLQGTVKFFLFDPVDAKTIYAKTFGPPAAMEKDRPPARPALVRSADAGRTWRLVRADSAAGQLTALAVDPADSNIVYGAFKNDTGSALSVSSDRGATWPDGTALPAGGERVYIDPASPKGNRTIYVVGTNAVSVRAGGAWSHGPAATGVRAFSDVSGGFSGGKLVVYGIARNAIHVSEDGGRSWMPSPFPGFTPALRAVATSANHGETAYVSYSGSPAGERVMGVAKTTDRGRTWELVWKDGKAVAANMAGQWLEQIWGPGWGGNPISLGVDPTNPDLCYGTDNGRTVRTTDGGKTWQAIYSKEMPGGSWATTGLDVTTNYGVHFDPFDAKRLFIGYTDIGLFRSENGGKSWFAATTNVPHPWANTTYWIVFDPQVKGRVWGAMSGAHDLPRPKMFGGAGSVARYIGGACRSEDGARTWDCTSDMPQTALTHIVLDAKSPADARVLYATGFGRGVFKSTDGGKHWTLKNKGISGGEPFTWRLAGDPGGALYVVVARRSNDGGIGNAGDGALYRTTDGAEHWSPVALPEGVNGPHGLAVDPKDPKRLYLAAWGRRPQDAAVGGGIYLSKDGGATWRQVLDKDQHIGDVTIDPRDGRVLYATGFEGNAWRSADRGETWQRIRGYNFRWGQRVIPDPADAGKIYVTTYGGGVWHGPAKGDPGAAEDIVP